MLRFIAAGVYGAFAGFLIGGGIGLIVSLIAPPPEEVVTGAQLWGTLGALAGAVFGFVVGAVIEARHPAP